MEEAALAIDHQCGVDGDWTHGERHGCAPWVLLYHDLVPTLLMCACVVSARYPKLFANDHQLLDPDVTLVLDQHVLSLGPCDQLVILGFIFSSAGSERVSVCCAVLALLRAFNTALLPARCRGTAWVAIPVQSFFQGDREPPKSVE